MGGARAEQLIFRVEHYISISGDPYNCPAVQYVTVQTFNSIVTL